MLHTSQHGQCPNDIVHKLGFQDVNRRLTFAIWSSVLKSGSYDEAWLSGASSDIVLLDGRFELQPEANAHRLLTVLESHYNRRSRAGAFATMQRLLAYKWDGKSVSGSAHIQYFNDLMKDLGRYLQDDKPTGTDPFGPSLTAYLLLLTLPQSLSMESKILLSKDESGSYRC